MSANIGEKEQSEAGNGLRVVDKLVLHGGCIDFRTLCERVVTEQTRYLVLDLDRTVYFAQNVGELLGWELCGWIGYGPEKYEILSARERKGRFLWGWTKYPFATANYLSLGVRWWAFPGLYYLLMGKVGYRLHRMRRWVYRRLGHEAIESVQRIPRTALMHHLTRVPYETAHMLAERVLERIEADQVITADDVRWLKERYPNLKVVISSASPRPAVAAVAERLGIDDYLFSQVEEQGGYPSSPSLLKRAFLLFQMPRRISPPHPSEHNAGRNKIRNLRRRYPDFDRVETVGITDTGYGEDHTWAEYFTRVADINSADPFPPLVKAGSPVEEIHSACVLTRSERDGLAVGQPIAPERSRIPETRVYTRNELEQLFGERVSALSRMIEQAMRLEGELSQAARQIHERLGEVSREMEQAVQRFNAAEQEARRQALASVRRLMRRHDALEAQYRRLVQPVSQVFYEVGRQREEARRQVARHAAS